MIRSDAFGPVDPQPQPRAPKTLARATTLVAPAAPDPAARPGSRTQGHNQC